MSPPLLPFDIGFKKVTVVYDKRFHPPCETWEIRRRKWPNLVQEQIWLCHTNHQGIHTLRDVTSPGEPPRRTA